MSVTIRLARIGRKNLPAYRIVVSNTRDKRNGRFLDELGNFNPSGTTPDFNYDKEKFNKWVKDGALVTDSVQKLIDGKYNYTKYAPKQVHKKAEGGEAPAKEEAKGETKPEAEAKEEVKEEVKEEKKEEKTEEKKEKKEKKEEVKEEPKKEEPKEEK